MHAQANTQVVLKAWLSPRSSSGSFLTSVAAHFLAAATVVTLMNVRFTTSRPAPAVEAEMEYEVFEEPPQVLSQPRVTRVAQAEAVPEPAARSAPTQTQELQDAQSEVSGTQQAQAVNPDALGTGPATAVAEAAPFYKIKPKYPRAALISGEEGWILLRVDVSESGEVENIRVVDGEKRNLFQDEARRAVSKWKYKPFTDAAGRPIRKADHQVRIDFKLQDA
jgi:protein TonB